jgi:hypothetical protein
MHETTNGTTRRSVLGRLALAIGGVGGVGVGVGVGPAAAAKSRIRGEANAVRPGGQPMTLHARELRAAPLHRDPRSVEAREDAPFGELLDQQLRPVGAFRAVVLPTGGSLHTFELPDGQLFGIGAGGLEGTAHAIVGGTGRFTGAAGSYSIEPASRLPGRSVSFAFTLTALEA